MTTLYEGAYAKLNLTLDVLGKRDDGYHDLKTVMQTISLRDDIQIDLGTGKPWAIVCDKEGVPTDETNLCWKAARLYFDTVKKDPDGLTITITKRIPMQAGLGGGSADAAFALKMLNDIAGLGLTAGQLRGYASRIGADCAFFIYNTPMMATGIGDILSPTEVQLKGKTLLLVKPNVSVPTAVAYSRVTPKPSDIELTNILSQPIAEWKNLLKNDFEPSVFAAHPELADIKQQIYDLGAVYASMSGSGSSIFGIFESANMAENAKSTFAEIDAYVINL